MTCNEKRSSKQNVPITYTQKKFFWGGAREGLQHLKVFKSFLFRQSEKIVV